MAILEVSNTRDPRSVEPSSRRRWLAAGILVGAALSLTGCALPAVEKAVVDYQKVIDPLPKSAAANPRPSTAGAPAATTAPAPAPAPAPAAPVSASTVLSNTNAAVDQAKSAHVRATYTDSSKSVVIDVATTMDASNFSLTIEEGGSKAEIIRVASALYVRADRTYWQRYANASAASLANKWVKMNGAQADQMAAALPLNDMFSLTKKIRTDRASVTATTHQGKPAYLVTETPGNTSSGSVVIDAGSWLPAKLQAPGVEMLFDSWNSVGAFKAPVAAVTVSA